MAIVDDPVDSSGVLKATQAEAEAGVINTKYMTPLSTKQAVAFEKQQVVQVVNVTDGAVATGTTVIPYDNTIPQNTEGDEYLTLAITPKSATNILVIEVVTSLSSSSNNNGLVAALFQDSTANALACSYGHMLAVPVIRSFSHYMVAGTTSATTFKIRCGGDIAGTTTFNGNAGLAKYGGVVSSSITITEYTP